MIRKFKSLTNDQIGYMLDTGAEFTTNWVIERFWRMFQTFGDGMTQHSADYPVTKEALGDFLFSLASFLLENLSDEEFIREVAFDVWQGPKQGEIEFASSIRFKESDREYMKQRFFSIREQKIGTRKKCEFDKRYEQIGDWCDGGAKAIFRIITAGQEYMGGLEALVKANAIYRHMMLEPGSDHREWMDSPADFLNWFGESRDEREKRKDAAKNIRLGLAAVLDFVDGWNKQNRAKCEVGNYIRNLPKPAESTETAA